MHSWLKLMRIKHWVKNLLVFAPAFFAGKILEKQIFLLSFWAFFGFCFCASSLYIVNDILDLHADRNHPIKKNRPLARGDISVFQAIILAVICLIGSFCFSYNLGRDFFIVIGIYILLNISYSVFLKRIPLLEIFIVSFGYLLRITGGGIATKITVSSWLFMGTFLISLLIFFGKRRAEIVLLKEQAQKHRAVLSDYDLEYLNLCVVTTGASSLVMYVIYAVEKGNHLIYTAIPAAYGILRYLKLVLVGKGGDPIETLIKDHHLWIAVVLFLAGIALAIY